MTIVFVAAFFGAMLFMAFNAPGQAFTKDKSKQQLFWFAGIALLIFLTIGWFFYSGWQYGIVGSLAILGCLGPCAVLIRSAWDLRRDKVPSR